MPYQIKKIENYFQLYNLSKKKLLKTKFKSRETAINQAKNWMRYRKEKPVVQGNKILNAKKKNKK